MLPVWADPTSRPTASFELTDHDGRHVNAASFRGRHVLVFFGFTHCRVVCPRALTRISDVLAEIGSLADQITALYVTVDPERDTPDVMRAFLKPFPRFLGLTGSRDQIDQAKRNFRVFARRADDPLDVDGYAMPHTAIVYLLDPTGAFVAHFNDAVPPQDIVASLQALIKPAAGTFN